MRSLSIRRTFAKRSFLLCTVRFLVSEAGIRQLADAGTRAAGRR
jgi:hypothetical protein